MLIPTPGSTKLPVLMDRNVSCYLLGFAQNGNKGENLPKDFIYFATYILITE